MIIEFQWIELSPTVERTVPKIPAMGQISLQGGGGVVQDSIYVTSLVSMICDINDSASLVVGHSDGINLSLPKCSDRFY